MRFKIRRIRNAAQTNNYITNSFLCVMQPCMLVREADIHMENTDSKAYDNSWEGASRSPVR